MSHILDFARDELKLNLYPGQAQLVTAFEEGRYSEGIWVCGRRGGKSLLADMLALYDACARDHLRDHLLLGEPRVSAIIAPRLEQAAAHIARCSRLAQNSSHLKRMIVSETTEELRFANGSAIRSYPCSARGLRGDPWSSCILDELGWFVDSDNGNAAGDVVLQSAKPSLAQFAQQGWLVAISTPRWKVGALWTLAQQAQSGRFPRMQYVSQSTRELNPGIDPAWLDEERRKDPENFAREYEAQWIDTVSSYLPSADVLACKRLEGILSAVEDVTYRACIDPAYAADNFSMAVGHVDQETKVTIVDGVWVWHRAGHENTLNNVAEVAKQYHVRSVRTDQFCSQPVREGLERRGLQVEYTAWTAQNKLDAYSSLKAGLSTRSLELPDDPELVEELCGLEARALPSGATQISAPPGRRDDRATALAGLMALLRVKKPLEAVAPFSITRISPWSGDGSRGFFVTRDGLEATPREGGWG